MKRFFSNIKDALPSLESRNTIQQLKMDIAEQRSVNEKLRTDNHNLAKELDDLTTELRDRDNEINELEEKYENEEWSRRQVIQDLDSAIESLQATRADLKKEQEEKDFEEAAHVNEEERFAKVGGGYKSPYAGG